MTITITGYLDLEIEQAREQQEAHGREYAREIGKPWPMPPDRYGPGRQPRDRAAYYQRFEAGIIEDESRARALLVVTAGMELRVDRVVQVDGSRTVRLADTRAKLRADQLPPRWRDRLDSTTRSAPAAEPARTRSP